MPAENIVKINRLTAHYGERKVLNQVDMAVHTGEIMAVMGGSGAGKSTLLRHMLGLQQPTSGHVHVLGKDITTLAKKDLYALRKKMGVAFQGGALLTSMNVGDNVALPLRELTQLDENTIRIMTRMKLEMVNLAGCEKMMPAELSGGMLKRTALARAVIMDPRLLFIDEPSSGLDPITAVEIDELILSLRQALNMTIVVITHELQSALKIADRITVLTEGKAIFTGTVEQLQQSDDGYIKSFLSRQPLNQQSSDEDYMRRLTENS